MSSVTFAMIGSATFTGLSGTAPINVPGMRVGDMIFGVFPGGEADNVDQLIVENVVSVNDQIQQTANVDYSSATITVLFARAVV